MIFASLLSRRARVGEEEDEDENEGNDESRKGKYTHTMPISFSQSLPACTLSVLPVVSTLSALSTPQFC